MNRAYLTVLIVFAVITYALRAAVYAVQPRPSNAALA